MQPKDVASVTYRDFARLNKNAQQARSAWPFPAPVANGGTLKTEYPISQLPRQGVNPADRPLHFLRPVPRLAKARDFPVYWIAGVKLGDPQPSQYMGGNTGWVHVSPDAPGHRGRGQHPA